MRIALLATLIAGLSAAEAPTLLPATPAGATPSSATVTIAGVTIAPGVEGLAMTCAPGQDQYPGLRVTAPTPWDLSAHAGIAARVTNTGTEKAPVFLRVDNAGDWKQEPWNTERIDIDAGATATITVRFGRSWGKPGFTLDPARITGLQLWTSPAKTEPRSFRIESILPVAAIDAEQAEPKRPTDGQLLGPGATAPTADRLRTAKARATVTDDGAIDVSLDAGGSLVIAAPGGRWDLRDHLRLTLRLRNTGTTPVRPSLRIETKGGSREAGAEAIAAGAEGVVAVSFLADRSWVIGSEDLPRFASDQVTGLRVTADGAASLRLLAATADAPTAVLPDWLGKRPPVDGAWTATLSEEFDTDWLNTRIWSDRTNNYWDKRCHFSAEQVKLGDGTLRLRFEAKKGRQNDDALGIETDYATGVLTSYDRWTQKYGYFECRMKLPKAPGLWPAFWLMPDRGPEAGIWWKRNDTGTGGMEFDVFEHLTRFGPYRTNLAMHWDGYGKNHKSAGSGDIYYALDSEGFVTSGLLWEPGRAVFYLNGTEVLRWENERVASVPMHILFTNVSGGWGGNTLDGSGLPDDYVLDYVRVWQRDDLATAP